MRRQRITKLGWFGSENARGASRKRTARRKGIGADRLRVGAPPLFEALEARPLLAAIVIQPSPANLITTEAAGSQHTAQFTIALDSQPSANVTVPITGNPAEGTLSVSSVVFTTSNWNVPRTVVVTGVDDFVDDGDVEYTIVTGPSVSADDAFDGLNGDDITVTSVDNDVAGVTVSESSLTTTEAAGANHAKTFTIRLNSQPTGNVVITLGAGNPAEGTRTPGSLTFTTANWNVAQTVTVTGVDDNVDDGDVTYTITTAATSADPKYNGISVPDVTVTNQDDDEAGVTLSATSLTTTEAPGANHVKTFTVVLDSQPTANVVITLGAGNPAEGTRTPGSLTFTTANWNVAQTVTVTGVDENIDDGDVTYTITTSAASADPKYNGIPVANVTVTNVDNDVAGITVTPTTLTTSEGPGPNHTQTFTVVLNSQPTANVTIGILSNDTTEGTVSSGSLTFTSANWNTPQTVTVTGVDDFAADGNITYLIVTTAAVSTDAKYNGLDASDVSVTNTDDDSGSVGITVAPVSLTTAEDELASNHTAQFIVVLNTQPTANVTIAISSSDTTEGVVDKSLLTFTPANWFVPQTVTVTGVDDTDSDGNVLYTIVTGTSSSADTNYNGINPPDVSVRNVDNDFADLRVQVTDTPDPVAVNQLLTYRVTVTNNGPAIAKGATLQFTLPDNVRNQDDSPITNPVRTFNLGDLELSATRVITISVKPNIAANGQTLEASARVSSTITDPTPSNNNVTATTSVGGGLNVTNFSDSDEPGTLRFALNLANESEDLDVITIVSESANPILRLTGLLPNIVHPVVIRASSSVGFLTIDAGLGNDDCSDNLSYIFKIDAGGAGSTIQDVALVRYRDYGIWLEGGGANTIIHSYVGIDADGNDATCKGAIGIYVNGSSNNTIGGTTPALTNVIVNNTTAGIKIASEGDQTGRDSAANVIVGNHIGTFVPPGAPATTPESLRPNGDGILLSSARSTTIGGSVSTVGAGAGNRIAGNNGAGIKIENDTLGTVIRGNRVGSGSLTGSSRNVPNLGGGIVINAELGSADAVLTAAIGDLIGSGRNVISGNTGAGILVNGKTAGLSIHGNWIGLALGGDNELPNTVGIDLNGATNVTVRGDSARSATSVVSGNREAGILLRGGASAVTITDTMIGVDAGGLDPGGNDGAGIEIRDARNIVIGRTAGAIGNVISANGTASTPAPGIDISTNAREIRIVGNLIGLTARGDAGSAVGNTAGGIHVAPLATVTIGGSTAADRNVISWNQGAGIAFTAGNSAGVVVRGNYIGTDPTGAVALGNALGILATGTTGLNIGGSGAGDGNVISGNTGAGISLVGATTTAIEGNKIGTGASGESAVPNGVGVQIDAATTVTVGGTANGARNVISGNSGAGVHVSGGDASGVLIIHNYIGLSADGSDDVGNVDGVVILNASNVVVGGDAENERNVISGNSANGVRVSGSAASGNRVQGNFIGTSQSGESDIRNGVDGVVLEEGARNNLIGGVASVAGAGLGNLIAGNARAGVRIRGASSIGNQVFGNVVGSQRAGDRLGNSDGGVVVDGGGANTIGGTATGQRNIISGNATAGVVLTSGATHVTVAGNYIGTTVEGTDSIGNLGAGVKIEAGASQNTIDANLISGNQGDGIWLIGATTTGNLVTRNRIGTDASGNEPLGNTGSGVHIQDARNNLIGGESSTTATGALSGAGNLISANRGDGVLIDVESSRGAASGNSIFGNWIGRDLRGTNSDLAPQFGNTNSGIALNGAGVTNNDIGDGTAAHANYIVENAIGVRIADARAENRIRGNVISSNDSDGVQLTGAATEQRFEGNFVQANTGNGFALLTAPGNHISTGNVIAGNSLSGILISGASGNRVEGSVLSGNTLFGVFLSNASGNTIGDGNYIFNNRSHGIVIQGTFADSNVIQNNTIGVDRGGRARGNDGDGVVIVDGADNRVDANTIQNNNGNGVAIADTGADLDGAARNVVTRNTIGGEGTGGNRLSGISILNARENWISANTVIGDNKLHGISLFGARAAYNTIESNAITTNALDGINLVDAPLNSIARNAVFGNAGDGIELSGSGTHHTPLSENRVIGNALSGIRVVNAPSNLIGAGNVIYGNRGAAGIEISGVSTGTTIVGNKIGVEENGLSAPDNKVGVLLTDTSGIVIGGSSPVFARDPNGSGVLPVELDPLSANIISDNGFTGIQIAGTGSTGITVQNNYIGLAGDGESFLGNGARADATAKAGGDGVGVWITQAVGNTIRGNIISGHDFAGIHVQGRIATETSAAAVSGTKNSILDNLIGTDRFGKTPFDLVNERQGVSVGAADREVKHFQAASNQVHGILLNATVNTEIKGNLVAGNDVGIRAVGDTATIGDPSRRRNTNTSLNNTITTNVVRDNDFGVFLDGSADISVTDNTISQNISIGVSLRGNLATRNEIRNNTIDGNQGLIDFPAGKPAKKPAYIGTGVYIERAIGNKIVGNRVRGNRLAGVYLFDNASNNAVRENTITPLSNLRGDYGILLFNSARNLSGVIRKGRGANRTNGAILANFREYTGARTETLVALPNLPGQLTLAQVPAGPNALIKRAVNRRA